MSMTKLAGTVVRILAAVVVLLTPWAVLTAAAAPAQAAVTETRILSAPLDLRLYLPCAGEVVHLTGTITEIYHVTFDEATGFHVTLVEVQQGVLGVGETTGDRYVSTRVNFFNYNEGSGGLPITSTQQLVYRVDGPGTGNESLIRIRNHSTLNADGTMTVAFDVLSVECEATSP